MGCGSSKLKGEEQTSATEDAPQPIKKVQTNFSTVDYDAAGQGRRDTTVGPLEPVHQKSDAIPPLPEEQDDSLNTAVAPDPAQPETKITKGDQISFENKIRDQQPQIRDPATRNPENYEKIEPYRDVTVSPTTPVANNAFNTEDEISHPQITSAATDKQGGDQNTGMGLFSKMKSSPGEAPELSDGTSRPALPTLNNGDSDTNMKTKKKSLYQKYQDLKRGPGVGSMSDEELKKYTGKTKEELDDYSRTTPGVAGGQAAGSLTAGGTSGIGMAGGAGEGLGGWGTEAGKQPTVR